MDEKITLSPVSNTAPTPPPTKQWTRTNKRKHKSPSKRSQWACKGHPRT